MREDYEDDDGEIIYGYPDEHPYYDDAPVPPAPPGAPAPAPPKPGDPVPPPPDPGPGPGPAPTSSGGGDRPRYLSDGLYQGWGTPFMPSRPNLGQVTLPTLAAFKPPKLPDIKPFESPGPFAAPDPKTIMDDPSYQWREGQGRNSLENAAATSGLLRSGGTLKDLVKYGQQFAANEYSDIYGRAADVYDRNFRNLLTTWGENRKTAFDSYGAELSGLLPGHEDEQLRYSTEAQNAQRQAELDYDREWQNYMTGRDSFYRNQGNDFDHERWEWEFGLDAATA